MAAGMAAGAVGMAATGIPGTTPGTMEVTDTVTAGDGDHTGIHIFMAPVILWEVPDQFIMVPEQLIWQHTEAPAEPVSIEMYIETV